MVPFNWDIQLTVYLFVIPLRCLVADYNKILFLNQSNGYKGEEGGISKSLGVVKKDKELFASDMQMTHSKANILANIWLISDEFNNFFDYTNSLVNTTFGSGKKLC